MSYTKRKIIELALAEIGLGEYAYDAQAEDMQDALIRLNALMGQWAGNGSESGWPSANTEFADDLDDDSNLPVDAVRGVICGLAIDLAPQYGKQPSPRTIASAREGKRLMARKSALTPPRKATDTMATPSGAGHKHGSDQVNLAHGLDEILQGSVTNG